MIVDKLILKSPRFVSFRANLTQFGPKLDFPTLSGRERAMSPVYKVFVIVDMTAWTPGYLTQSRQVWPHRPPIWHSGFLSQNVLYH